MCDLTPSSWWSILPRRGQLSQSPKTVVRANNRFQQFQLLGWMHVSCLRPVYPASSSQCGTYDTITRTGTTVPGYPLDKTKRNRNGDRATVQVVMEHFMLIIVKWKLGSRQEFGMLVEYLAVEYLATCTRKCRIVSAFPLNKQDSLSTCTLQYIPCWVLLYQVSLSKPLHSPPSTPSMLSNSWPV